VRSEEVWSVDNCFIASPLSQIIVQKIVNRKDLIFI